MKIPKKHHEEINFCLNRLLRVLKETAAEARLQDEEDDEHTPNLRLLVRLYRDGSGCVAITTETATFSGMNVEPSISCKLSGVD